jgi:IS1 family transposase
MNHLSAEKRAQVVAALVEGNSIRATVRMTGVAKNTVTKLLVDIGTACSVHMDTTMRDLPCERIQVDEIWAFCYSRQKNVPHDHKGEFGYGDVWMWVALDAGTKLAPSYRVAARDLYEATMFLKDLERRLAHRVQLTTDEHTPYLTAVRTAFTEGVDYAQLQKIYGKNGGGSNRYSPPVFLGAIPPPISGDPDPAHISTSYVERQNLTMRISMRRFTRLTNAFSKKVENMTAAVSLHFAHYNYCLPHMALGKKVTPARAAGLTDHVWTLTELIALLERAEATPIKRGSYTKTRERKRVSD